MSRTRTRTHPRPRSRTVRRTHVVGLGAAALALTLLAPATTAAAGTPPGPQPAPVLSHPRIITHFDLAAGGLAENIALEPDGSADITLAGAHQVVRVSLKGEKEVLATLPPEAGPQTPVTGSAVVTGIARAKDGTLYVNYATGTDALTGVWRLTPDGVLSRLAALPGTAFPNGMALDEEHGVLYTADSVLAKVWRVSLDDGAVTTWATGTELARTTLVGANGLKFRHGAVWVTNTDKGTLLRIPVRKDGGAGPIATRATGLTLVDDFAFTGKGETVLAAMVVANEIALVRPDGTHTIVLTEQAGLSSPTSLAVRGHKVYINSAGFLDPTDPDPNLLVALQRQRPGHRHDGPGTRGPAGWAPGAPGAPGAPETPGTSWTPEFPFAPVRDGM
ncbi:SMP-30/gluconolactonase/LRE family protein [Streptomyces sp. NPDC101118]|uniref:SMP-30/gluconolactonase/LRE family protein n=1 Tax=Streptomyces sp. NPDC101118 TaxID=3366109 RepID=UPI003820BEB3